MKTGILLTFIVFVLYPTILQAQNETVPGRSDTIHIREVTVSGKSERKITGMLTGKTVLNPEALSGLPSILGNTDVLKLLELTPGVQNAGDANTNMYVRGGEPGQNLLLYNNTPIYSQGHLLGFFSLFNADHLEFLELNKSAIDASYGGRLSSVVSIGSKKNIPERTGVQGSVGLLSSQATVSASFGKKWGAYLSGRKTYISLLMNPLLDATVNNNAENRIDGTAYDFYDGNLTVTGQISDRHHVFIDAFGGKDQLKIADNDVLLNGTVQWSNRSLSASWMYLPDDDRKLNQVFFYSGYENNLSTSQEAMHINLRSDIENWGYKNQFDFRWKDIRMRTGIQYTYYDIQPQSAEMQNMSIGFHGRKTGSTHAHELGGCITSHYVFFSRFTVDAGLRYNLFASRNRTFNSMDPRLSFRYKIKDDLFLRAAYNRQNQYINLLSPSSVGIPTDFWVCATETIRPQSGNEVSTGYYQTFFDDRFEISADLYFRNMSGITEFNQNLTGSYDKPFTEGILYGEGKAYGLECMLKKNTGKLTGWISYTLGKSERTFDEINKGKTFPARFDRRHDVSLVAMYAFNSRWDASAVFVYATGSAYTLPSSWYFINNNPVKQYGAYNSARMPDYNRTDLSVNYWFKKDNGINFSVYNLFMVNNPVYVFLNVKQDTDNGKIQMDVKRKKLSTITPSISWRFQF